MKKILIALLISICSSPFCISQDILTKNTGEDIEVKVLEITTQEVRYKKFDNQDGPIYTILKPDLLMIRYENGTKDIFKQENKTELISITSDDLFSQGQADASRYYKGYKGAGTGTLITSLISPIVGLIPAIACSSTSPKEANLDFPNASLMNNPEYYNGYTKKAKKIKQGKVWKNWGVAMAVNIAAVLILSSTTAQ